MRVAPDPVRVLVGVDPPAGSGPVANACGIVVASLGGAGVGHVLEDVSV